MGATVDITTVHPPTTPNPAPRIPMSTSIRLVALRPISLPHRVLAAGDALDFGRPDDLAFFTSRLRWSAFTVQTVTEAPLQVAEMDATVHQGLKDAAERLKAAEATIAQQAERIAELEAAKKPRKS
jgi:hypothetical protein